MSIALVTGAGSGVGRATAIALSERGWTVALLGHGELSLKETAALMPSPCSVWPVDVADARGIATAVQRIEAEVGPIEACVNAAATAVFGPLLETELADLGRVLDVTANGLMYTSLAVAKPMADRNFGTIVNVGSSLAFTAVPYNVAYGAAKAAIRSFSLGLGLELRSRRVKVCIAHLPAIATPWFTKVKTLTPFQSKPVGVMHSPTAVGEALADLVERPRMGDSYLGLSTVIVVAGARLFPRVTGWFALHLGVRWQTTHEAAPTSNNLYSSIEPTVKTSPKLKALNTKLHWYPRLGSSTRRKTF